MSIMLLQFEQPTLLHHGGRLRAAATRYTIALKHWLDLSTGANPNGWPVPALPGSVWTRLPENDDGLEHAAREYYGVEHVLPVAGSQAAIQALPHLRPRSRVYVLNPGYTEHAAAWRRADHTVIPVTADQINNIISDADVLVLIHPNNPTGIRFPVDQLLDWHTQLAAHGGWLIVDETFIDATPDMSLASYADLPGLIVLRSLSQFFGLAGARVGFVCAEPTLLKQLSTALGPWTVNTPARWIATAALKDYAWHDNMRQRLPVESARLKTLLAHHGLTSDGGCALFHWCRTPRAAHLHEGLARQGILTRLFAIPSSLRFGLPGSESDWQRLETALTNLDSKAARGQI